MECGIGGLVSALSECRRGLDLEYRPAFHWSLDRISHVQGVLTAYLLVNRTSIS